LATLNFDFFLRLGMAGSIAESRLGAFQLANAGKNSNPHLRQRGSECGTRKFRSKHA
jgi:hypothetical protein